MARYMRRTIFMFKLIIFLKEFFEKRKLKSKFKLLGSPLSPQQSSSVSWDLLTLHIVNRIAAKKEPNDVPNKITQVDMKKDTKMPIWQHNIELPMSPCSIPSRIFLEESQCRSWANQSPSFAQLCCSDTGKFPVYKLFSKIVSKSSEELSNTFFQNLGQVSQEKEWSSRTKHSTNLTNLKYREPSPVMESTSVEHNVMDSSCSSMDRFNGYPLSDSWTCAQSYPLQENRSTEPPTGWDSSYDNQQHLQQHFLFQDDKTALTETIGHTAVLTDHIVPNCTSLLKHSNGRLLQNYLESSGLHSNNEREYASFAVQDAFPSSQNVASTRQSMTYHDRDFPLTQCSKSESSQSLFSHICQEEFIHSPLTLAETSFKINVPYQRSDLCRTSVIGPQSVIQNKKKENIFVQPTPDLFKEPVQKDHFGENSSHDERFLESNLGFNVQENNGFFQGFKESRGSLNYRRTALNDSFESSQSPSYSPKETESCCSAFSDLSELDGQSMQPDISVTNKGSVPEMPFDIQAGRENLKVYSVLQEYLRETNCTSKSCSYPISKNVTHGSIASNVAKSEQKESPDQFVPSSSMNCSSDTINSKSFQVQNAWTQTECSFISMKRSDIAIQCNLSNATECLSLPIKEPTSLNDDSNNLVHTIRGYCKPSNKYSHCSDISTQKPTVLTEKDPSLDNSFEELDDTKCLKVRREKNIKTITNCNNSSSPSSYSESEIQRPENQQIKESLQNENYICSLSDINNTTVSKRN